MLIYPAIICKSISDPTRPVNIKPKPVQWLRLRSAVGQDGEYCEGKHTLGVYSALNSLKFCCFFICAFCSEIVDGGWQSSLIQILVYLKLF